MVRNENAELVGPAFQVQDFHDGERSVYIELNDCTAAKYGETVLLARTKLAIFAISPRVLSFPGNILFYEGTSY